MSQRIGFLQGFLSPAGEGALYWEQELQLADTYGFSSIEWLLDQDGLSDSPLMSVHGRRKIIGLLNRHKVSIRTLYASCAMQFPFWKCDGTVKNALLSQFKSILKFASEVGIKTIVVPLVYNGSIENKKQEERVARDFFELEWLLQSCGLELCFESNYSAKKLHSFISRFSSRFGVSLNTGSPDPLLEIQAYGSRVMNVHVTDRTDRPTFFGEGTVPFPEIFRRIESIGYTGMYILRTLRREHFIDSGVQDRDLLLRLLANEK